MVVFLCTASFAAVLELCLNLPTMCEFIYFSFFFKMNSFLHPCFSILYKMHMYHINTGRKLLVSNINLEYKAVHCIELLKMFIRPVRVLHCYGME